MTAPSARLGRAGVGEVEVAREEQEAVEEGAVAHKGMAGAEVVSPEGGVAQVAQKEFAPEGLRILGQAPSAPRQQIGEG